MGEKLSEAMMTEHWPTIVEYLLSRHGVVVDESQISTACVEPLKRLCKKDARWSDGTWDLWLRKRVDELRLWPSVPWQESFDDLSPTEMHVFFPFLQETLEMLAKLPEGAAAPAKVARSKVSSTIAAEITPIDSVAGRVVK